MKKVRITGGLVFLAFLIAFVLLTASVVAHEGREVGPYEIVAGWRSEPAIVGHINGPQFRISEINTEEPVEGLEESLQLEVGFGDQSTTVEMQRVFGQPGSYTAHLLPTRSGEYTWHLTGMINDTEVDETFTSGAVRALSEVQFPDTEVQSLTDLQARVAELEALVEELRAQLESE